jgi:hypothetical protein
VGFCTYWAKAVHGILHMREASNEAVPFSDRGLHPSSGWHSVGLGSAQVLQPALAPVTSARLPNVIRTDSERDHELVGLRGRQDEWARERSFAESPPRGRPPRLDPDHGTR